MVVEAAAVVPVLVVSTLAVVIVVVRNMSGQKTKPTQHSAAWSKLRKL